LAACLSMAGPKVETSGVRERSVMFCKRGFPVIPIVATGRAARRLSAGVFRRQRGEPGCPRPARSSSFTRPERALEPHAISWRPPPQTRSWSPRRGRNAGAGPFPREFRRWKSSQGPVAAKRYCPSRLAIQHEQAAVLQDLPLRRQKPFTMHVLNRQ
jgi:hypothetical protein